MEISPEFAEEIRKALITAGDWIEKSPFENALPHASYLHQLASRLSQNVDPSSETAMMTSVNPIVEFAEEGTVQFGEKTNMPTIGEVVEDWRERERKYQEENPDNLHITDITVNEPDPCLTTAPSAQEVEAELQAKMDEHVVDVKGKTAKELGLFPDAEIEITIESKKIRVPYRRFYMSQWGAIVFTAITHAPMGGRILHNNIWYIVRDGSDGKTHIFDDNKGVMSSLPVTETVGIRRQDYIDWVLPEKLDEDAPEWFDPGEVRWAKKIPFGELPLKTEFLYGKSMCYKISDTHAVLTTDKDAAWDSPHCRVMRFEIDPHEEVVL